jgi:hypothetical protein
MKSIFDMFAPKPKVEEPVGPVPYADITVVLDRSSSMLGMCDGVVDGFNSYVNEMRKTPGDTHWTLIEFDDPSSAAGAKEEFPHVLYEDKNEKEVPYLSLTFEKTSVVATSGQMFYSGGMTVSKPKVIPEGCVPYQPRGGTALVDAVCKSIEKANLRTSGQNHVTRIMMVITDGEENSSTEYTTEKMRELIAKQQAAGDQYFYIGANQDAWDIAKKYDMATQNSYGGSVLSGAALAGAYNSFSYCANSAGVREALGSGFVGLRSAVSGCVGSGTVYHKGFN